MKSKTHIEIEDLPSYLQLRVQGVLDEYAELPVVTVAENRDVLFDLQGFQSINSMGIRLWIEWLSGMKFRLFFFRHCPKVFIDQLNNVVGFIPENSVIESFYVPYHSPVTDEEASILFRKGDHFMKGKILAMPEVLDVNFSRMEIDVLPEKYLRFLPRFAR
ncbi:MAG: hypothetical protein OM95_03965 [Bdellovibrio sp. ArHS]|uniref:hypothetical protein n=1 Tax=Bdellovibrio sp. ArHS TaxID=1569284 RepID=UPI00058362D9|nr:hypothetical protein [Bdellovibrio sp. ArHS]KHD89296.1 MAG: hypothetical protein OM95_03965 [Bdellovibrio sp. ArHS]